LFNRKVPYKYRDWNRMLADEKEKDTHDEASLQRSSSTNPERQGGAEAASTAAKKAIDTPSLCGGGFAFLDSCGRMEAWNGEPMSS
jgi:hypothetical protein